MAQPDLLAEKILHSDPQVGFGESSVLPYREHPLDTRGFEALERSQAREEARKEARKKNNEDFYMSSIKNLPEYEREFEGALGSWRNDILNKAVENTRAGVYPDASFVKDLYSHIQASRATKQMRDELEKTKTMPLSKYTNRDSVSGAALNKYDELAHRASQGDKSAFGESVIPDVNDPEHFMFDQYFYDKYNNRPNTVTSEEHVVKNDKGERIVGNKKTAKFVTTKDGKVVPGVDQSLINDELYDPTNDPDKLQARQAISSLTDKLIEEKALQLKLKDPRYKEMGVAQIKQSISTNPEDSNFKDFNKNKLAEDLVRKRIEKHQVVSSENNVGSLNEYNKDTGDNEDANLTHIFDTENPFGHRKAEVDAEVTVKNSYSPHEIRIGGAKADKGIYVNAKTLINPTNNGYYFFDQKSKTRTPEAVGDKKVVVSRLRLVPFDKKTKKLLVGNKEEMKNASNDMEWKWVAEGMLHEKNKKGDVEEKPVMMMYDEIKNDLKAKLGVDLKKRDISQTSTHELMAIIDQQYPNATPKEKVQIVKTLKGK